MDLLVDDICLFVTCAYTYCQSCTYLDMRCESSENRNSLSRNVIANEPLDYQVMVHGSVMRLEIVRGPPSVSE